MLKLYDYSELILIFYRLVTFKNLLNTFPSQFDKLEFINYLFSDTLLIAYLISLI